MLKYVSLKFHSIEDVRASPDRKRRSRHLAALLSASALSAVHLIPSAEPAAAACSNNAPTSGQTVACDASAPNPVTIGVDAVAGSTNVTINIGAGSAISVQRAIGRDGASVVSGSQITNSGTVTLTGGGGSGLNRGAGILGTGNNNILTNAATGVINTTGAFNDGLAADGSGNTLTNNGTITTAGPNAYGMTASWGQSGGGQPNNTLINTGTVTTNGSNARAASILGQNGVINNSGTLLTNGTSSTGAYLQGTNDRLINSGLIRTTGANSEGVFSNTAGSSFTATIENLTGGRIISNQGPALRTLNGATTITNAGLLSGGNGVALNGGNGNVTFILQTGSEIVGLANGGGGANQVRLQGAGLVTNAFTNFQTLFVEGADWKWNGTGTFANTFVNSGLFRLQSSLTGNVNIAAGTSLLAGNGANPSITPFPGGPPVTVTNAGTIDLTNGSSPAANHLTIAGNYVGNGGQLNVRSVLGADNSPSDRLVISGGAASGATGIGVTNAGGVGGLTVNDGILVVQTTNGATSTPGAFALANGPLLAGAYQYFLFRGGVTAGTQNNLYLRSSAPPPPPTPVPTPNDPTPAPVPPPVAAPGTPPLPVVPPGEAPVALFRPEAALYSAAPAIARQLGFATLGTFHDRQGDQRLLAGNGVASAAWARAFGEQTSQQWSGAVNPSFRGTIGGVQSGLDLSDLGIPGGHRDRIGIFGAYGSARGNVSGFSGGFQNAPVGSLAIDATSIGAYWTHLGPGGWYIDGVAMHSWYTGSPQSIQGLSARLEGTGFTTSLEGGIPISIAPNLVIEPQAQLIYQTLSLSPTQDAVSSIAFTGTDALRGRIGGRLLSNFDSGGTLFQPYLKANIWHDFRGRDAVTFANADIIDTQRMATAFEIGGGVMAQLSRTVGVFGSAGYTTGIDGNRRDTIQGNVGMRVNW